MRKYLLPLFKVLALCFFAVATFGQKQLKDQTEAEVFNLLCIKWQIVAQEVQGRTMKMPSEQKAYMNFKKNGVLSITDLEDYPWSWSYGHKDYKISMQSNGDADFFLIVSISTTQLVLLHTGEGYPIKIFLKPST